MSELRAEHLAKSFRGRRVINDVSIQVTDGEVVGLLGPNGAGKTTSFYLLVGLIECEHGAIHLDDEDITDYPMHQRARMGIGYLPQEASIFRKLTVADNIRAVLETRNSVTPAQREEIVGALLDELQIGHIRDSLGISLSGGERRRAEIARALAVEPKFMLLDEPFAGVDPISVIDIQRIIAQLRDKGIGILITDHNVRETLGICKRVYIISEGQVIADGDPQDILNDEQVKEVYLGKNFQL